MKMLAAGQTIDDLEIEIYYDEEKCKIPMGKSFANDF